MSTAADIYTTGYHAAQQDMNVQEGLLNHIQEECWVAFDDDHYAWQVVETVPKKLRPNKRLDPDLYRRIIIVPGGIK